MSGGVMALLLLGVAAMFGMAAYLGYLDARAKLRDEERLMEWRRRNAQSVLDGKDRR